MREFDPQSPQARCPLCGRDNQCAVTAGEPTESCWCQRATMDAGALQRGATAGGNPSCLCPACGMLKGEAIER